METLVDPKIWTEQAGLIGLVTLCLIISIWVLIKSQVKIHEMHREDLKFIQDLHRQERNQWQNAYSAQHREIITVIQNLREAIIRMSTSR